MISFGSAVTYFVGTVVSWRTLALIAGIFSSLFLLYKTEYNCSINWILIFFICRNYSMSCTTYRFILYSWISKMAGESIGLELTVYSVIECKL